MPEPAACPDPRKIAVINRRFWPISGAAEQEVSNLCQELAKSNHVNLITVRWQKHWPTEFRYQECDVFRLTKPSSGPFGTFRYLKSLSNHFTSQQYDTVIVFGIAEEASAIAPQLGEKCQLILRITQVHLMNINSFSNRQCDALKSAHSILADTPSTAEFIIRHFPEVKNRIKTTPAISRSPARPELATNRSAKPANEATQQIHAPQGEARKAAARGALSDAHPILQIDAGHPLVITAAPMENDLGVCDLVRAWKHVQRTHVTSRLWILGEGKLSPAVWEEIRELELVYTAIMPGFFDNFDLILDAADLYVHPLRTESSCCILEAAKRAGVCTIETASLEELNSATSSQSARPFVKCPNRGILVPRETPTTMAAAINYIIEHDQFAAEFSAEVQRQVLNQVALSPPITEDVLGTQSLAATSKTD